MLKTDPYLIVLLAVITGVILLNVVSPPWQIAGLVVFLVAVLYPAIEGLVELINRS